MKKYPISQTLRDQCQYDPISYRPLSKPANPIYMNIIGQTNNNDTSNLSYYFYTIEGDLWCRFGTFDHTPNNSNTELTEHLLLGDVQISVADLKAMIFDLEKVLKSVEEK